MPSRKSFIDGSEYCFSEGAREQRAQVLRNKIRKPQTSDGDGDGVEVNRTKGMDDMRMRDSQLKWRCSEGSDWPERGWRQMLFLMVDRGWLQAAASEGEVNGCGCGSCGCGGGEYELGSGWWWK